MSLEKHGGHRAHGKIHQDTRVDGKLTGHRDYKFGGSGKTPSGPMLPVFTVPRFVDLVAQAHLIKAKKGDAVTEADRIALNSVYPVYASLVTLTRYPSQAVAQIIVQALYSKSGATSEDLEMLYALAAQQNPDA